jgi:hypothetical protein
MPRNPRDHGFICRVVKVGERLVTGIDHDEAQVLEPYSGSSLETRAVMVG